MQQSNSKLILLLLLIGFSVQHDMSDRKENYFHFGTKMIPHPSKADRGGEDAFHESHNVIAVADGVGGWNNHGVDPSKYSRTLCTGIGDLIQKNLYKYIRNPQELMFDTHARDTHLGSSTLVITTLDHEKPILYTANLGDSGYLLFRKTSQKWEIVFVSEEQQKGFNFPYQLAYLKENGDSPDQADINDHRVLHNDIVVVGSDGLLDNLFPNQILRIVKKHVDNEGILIDPVACAKELADQAFEKSLDTKYNSPFAKRAKAKGYSYQGGKSDDITIVAAQIKLQTKSGEYPPPPPPPQQHFDDDL